MAGILDLLRGGAQPNVGYGGLGPNDTPITPNSLGGGLAATAAPVTPPTQHNGLKNILGILGDAISVGAGGQDWHAQREKEAQFAQGLNLLQQGDQSGLQLMGQADPKLASQVMNNLQTNQLNMAKARPEILNNQDKYDDTTFNRIAGMARASNVDTWPAMKAQIEKLAAARGYKGSLNLPDAWTPEWAESFSRQGIDPDKAATLENTEAYRDAVLKQGDQRIAETARDHNVKNEIGIGNMNIHAIQADNSNANAQAKTGIAGQNADTRAYNAQTARQRADTSRGVAVGKGQLPALPSSPPRGPKGPNDRTTFRTSDGRTKTWVSADGKNWQAVN